MIRRAADRADRQRVAGSRLRPSREERAVYTRALAAAVAEGRLTDDLYEERVDAVEAAASFAELEALVADVPFDPPEGYGPPGSGLAGPGLAGRGRRSGAGPTGGRDDAARAVRRAAGVLSVLAFSCAAVFGGYLALERFGSGAAGSSDSPAGAGSGAQGAADSGLALVLDDVPAMHDDSVARIVDVAGEQGVTELSRIWLEPHRTYAEGRDASGGYVSLSAQSGRIAEVGEHSGNDRVFIDLGALDFSLADVVAAAAAHESSAEPEVKLVEIVHGGSSEGNVIRVYFEDSEERNGVLLRLSDLERLD